MLARFALPPRCAGCGTVVDDDHRLCVRCWSTLRFLTPPWCASCHAPFPYDRGAGAICGRCIAAPPAHAGIRAAVAYDDIARTFALKLKYGGRLAIADTMARLMERHVPAGADLLVPVPLHRSRLWSRGFNQSVLIARAIGKRAKVPVDVTTLARIRATPILRDLGPQARQRAVAHAFGIDNTRRNRIAEREIVLVDDVYTSGATARACTRTLIAAGARSVTILCWARVLDDADD